MEIRNWRINSNLKIQIIFAVYIFGIILIIINVLTNLKETRNSKKPKSEQERGEQEKRKGKRGKREIRDEKATLEIPSGLFCLLSQKISLKLFWKISF